VNNVGPPILYRNDGGNDGDWLRIKTVGAVSNRDGVGARITITPDLSEPDKIQYREIFSGNSFLSQSEMTAHFGLGENAAAIDRVVINWPSGVMQTLSEVAPNTVLVVQEPLAGDFNCDMAVTSDDLAVWKDAFGGPNPGAADVNGDGIADGRDLLFWQRWMGTSIAPPPSNGSAPEPGGGVIASIAIAAFALRLPAQRQP
jgi:hypothetical protein